MSTAVGAKLLKSTVVDELYDQDFASWCDETARLLRAGRFEEVDVRHLAEEIEDMAKRDRREVRSRLRVLLVHLLKWEWQAGRRSRSWQRTIDIQRAELRDVFQQSPSLHQALAESVAGVYPDAVRRATLEAGLPASAFPARCPYTPTQILDHDFLPLRR